MRVILIMFLALTTCGALRAATFVTNDVDKLLVLTVASGESTYRLKSDHVNAWAATGYPIVKRGDGEADSSTGFSGFGGELRIEEGKFLARVKESLGNSKGCTVVSSGGILRLYGNTANAITFTGEHILLSGTIINVSDNGTPHENAFPGTLTICDDRAAIQGNTIGIGGVLVLGGHTLTATMNKQADFRINDIDVTSGGTIVQNQGHFRLAGTMFISAREACNLPHVETEGGSAIVSDVFGYGGNVAALTKTGDGTFTFNSCLAVTGETYVAQGTLKLGGSTPGTAGLTAAVTNFNTSSESEWLGFVGAQNKDAVASMNLYPAATNLLAVGEAQGFSETALKPNDAFRAWTNAEKYKLGAYRGYIWNNAATNKVYTFAASFADTEVLWVNGVQIFRSVNSQRYSANETYFVSMGEATLKPGPNEFVFLLGHYRTSSFGPKPGNYPQYGLKWANNSGLMYYEGHYVAHDYTDESDNVYHNVTNSSDFARFEDLGDGSFLTLTKQPPAALAPAGATYVPRFDALRFGNDDAEARGTLDLGGLADFPQNGLAGCPCLTNGTLRLSGAWTFTSADIAAHPLEVAAGAGLTFDNATLAFSAPGFPLGSSVILHAEPGATVTGVPTVAVVNGRSTIWEIRREESAEGINLILYGRKRGFIMEIR